jgi:hypothetical protein
VLAFPLFSIVADPRRVHAALFGATSPVAYGRHILFDVFVEQVWAICFS